MTIIVETGAVVANSNSYVSAAAVAAFMLDRNNTAWADADAEVQEAAIIIGQMSMDAKYMMLYFGFPTTRDQTMAWPRTRTRNIPEAANQPTQEGVIDCNGYEWQPTEIPTPLINAALQAVLVEFEGTFTNTTMTRDDFIKKKKLDVLETEWFDSATTVSQPFAAVVDQMLACISASGSPNNVNFRIDQTAHEIISNNYSYGYYSTLALHNWAGTSLNYQAVNPYIDLYRYFYNIKFG